MEDSLEKSLDQIQRQKVLRCINAFNCEIMSIYFNVFPIAGTGSYCEGNMRRNNSRFLWIFRQPLNIKYYLTALPSRKWMVRKKNIRNILSCSAGSDLRSLIFD
ncbi:hypothetical protein BVRB_2g036850 [Beta vulgaris subsp. vulgaris]|uniref:Uncharacterized protein n=1 Tax=Beta vulgaris subsp. vulgaris TaxID=3555 RepID=A0A0J8CVG1_BETVV|nr:hypothetical protein BVRB_2g036850 [Beta vulgaris subsp. vulgaris]